MISAVTEFLRQPLPLGKTVLPNRLALAPLAGTTDLSFRALAAEQGAGLTVTELVSARGIVYDPELERNYRYLAIDPDREPQVAIQLFGSDPADFTVAVERVLAHDLLGRCVAIDLNMGCPVPKVIKQGAGSALMRDPDRAARIAEAAVKAALPFGKPVTAKIRSGFDRDSVNAPELAKKLEAAGVAIITVHGRTRDQMYSGRADRGVIRAVKQAVTVPVYGNGDIADAASAAAMLEETGCDALMIGRAAQGNPWIFRSLLEGKPYEPTAEERRAVILRHFDALCETRATAVAVKEFRSQLGYYLKGARGAAALRREAFQIEDAAELRAFIRRLDG